jgi:hypothetical protein
VHRFDRVPVVIVSTPPGSSPKSALVTPGLDPGAQAATVATSRSHPVLDARVKPAHDDERLTRRRVKSTFDASDDAVVGETLWRATAGTGLDDGSR